MEAIFGSTGQAVHVAFVVMSQPAMQDAPMRKALIRVLESIRIDEKQRAWLDQLRGQPSESVNFGGLSGDEVRAQCAMITQAVKHLPKPEMWTLQAKYGHVEFEDITPADLTGEQLADAFDRATKQVEAATAKMRQARVALEASREQYLASQGSITSANVETTIRNQYEAARDDVRDAGGELARAEATARTVQIAIDRAKGGVTDSGRSTGGQSRRFAFSAERIEAIKGLSDWLRPQFPRIKPLALDCMLGRLFANHAKVGVTFRDLANSFGGNPMLYQRASFKMSNKLRELEDMAIKRLEERLVSDGVALPSEID